MLYITCRPIYVVLTRLNDKQIDELKKDPSKYQCPQRSINVRKVLLTRKAGPASRTRLRRTSLRQNASGSSKRKAPLGDEFDPIILEDEVININTEAKEALIAYAAVKSSSNSTEAAKLIKERRCSPSTIMLINLCSSDEEEDVSSVRMLCDENRDPLNIAESPPISKTFARKLTPKQTLRESLHLPRTINRLVIEQRTERR